VATEIARNQTVTAVVENKSGVLARVVGLFARRGFNIVSLNVAPTYDERFSRITFVYDTHSAPVEQVISQINKLINVISIEAVDKEDSVKRELLMTSIHATAETRPQIVELIRIFEGKVVDVGHDAVMAMLAGRPDKLDDFEALVRPYGIVEMQRSGMIALANLDRSAALLPL
jgi:acetolactate synthase I/III small subunit